MIHESENKIMCRTQILRLYFFFFFSIITDIHILSFSSFIFKKLIIHKILPLFLCSSSFLHLFCHCHICHLQSPVPRISSLKMNVFLPLFCFLVTIIWSLSTLNNILNTGIETQFQYAFLGKFL